MLLVRAQNGEGFGLALQLYTTYNYWVPNDVSSLFSSLVMNVVMNGMYQSIRETVKTMDCLSQLHCYVRTTP